MKNQKKRGRLFHVSFDQDLSDAIERLALIEGRSLTGTIRRLVSLQLSLGPRPYRTRQKK